MEYDVQVFLVEGISEVEFLTGCRPGEKHELIFFKPVLVGEGYEYHATIACLEEQGWRDLEICKAVTADTESIDNEEDPMFQAAYEKALSGENVLIILRDMPRLQ